MTSELTSPDRTIPFLTPVGDSSLGVSHLYHHVEQNPSCSYLLNPSECLGALRDFYIESF
ncbi:hypothetical protein N7455_011407 [Penicillium solitum]|uniref:uncharacterized protein n=1 Tax=Penicillium solitum TaxID=60172 RepID=UPI0017ED059F|nr:hypothetical protein HAV15_009757 [Penicillium sp. str. \